MTQLTKHIYHCKHLHTVTQLTKHYTTTAVTYIYPTFTSSDPTHQAYLLPLQLPTFTLHLHRVTQLIKHIFYHCSYLHLHRVTQPTKHIFYHCSNLHLPYVYIEWPTHFCHPHRQLNNQILVLAMTLQSVTKLTVKRFPTADKPPCPTPDLNTHTHTHTSDSHKNNLPITCWYLV